MNSGMLIAEIMADGWILKRVKGTHHPFTPPNKTGLVTIPHLKKDLPANTVKSIRQQAGL